MAKELIKQFSLDKIIFVPVGDYYEKKDLIDAMHRYNMLKLAIEDKMDVEEIAIESKVKLLAADTFELIQEKYKKDDICFVMGSDNFRKMPTWKNYEKIIEKYNIIVIERERKKIKYDNFENILEYIPEKFAEINSTKIRQMIKNNKGEVQKYLNEKVYRYIIANNLYI